MNAGLPVIRSNSWFEPPAATCFAWFDSAQSVLVVHLEKNCSILELRNSLPVNRVIAAVWHAVCTRHP